MIIDETFTDLLTLSAAIAIGFLMAVAFYESLSTRDVLVRRMTRIARHSYTRRPESFEGSGRRGLILELAELLARARRLLRRRVVADQLREREPGVGRVTHLDEEVALRPERGRRLVALRVLRDDAR